MVSTHFVAVRVMCHTIEMIVRNLDPGVSMFLLVFSSVVLGCPFETLRNPDPERSLVFIIHCMGRVRMC